MLIFTVGIELTKHAYLLGGNSWFSLFNLMSGIIWLTLVVLFLRNKQVGMPQAA